MKITHPIVSALALSGLLGFAGRADAQVAAAPVVFDVPANPGARLHDGFYLRLATGFGAYSEAIREAGASKQTTVAGVATVTELGIGGAIRPGLILGGGVWSSSVLASDRTTGGNTPPPEVVEGRGDFSLVGPFFDYYFDPRRGLHLQSAIGIANTRGVNLDSGNVDEDAISVGLGVMFGVGYEWWVSEEWSIGVLGRYALGATGQKDKAGTRWYHFVAGTPSVLFSATYN